MIYEFQYSLSCLNCQFPYNIAVTQLLLVLWNSYQEFVQILWNIVQWKFIM